MDPKILSSHAGYLGRAGVAIGLEERTALMSSLPVLQKDERLQKIVFWGKLFGRDNDYFIAEGFGDSIVDDRITFYSEDHGVSWKRLPVPTEIDLIDCAKINSLLVGLPDFSYQVEMCEEEIAKREAEKVEKPAPAEGEEAGEAEEEEGEEGGEEEKGTPKKKVSELMRVAVMVHNIDTDTFVVPRGAFILNSEQKVVKSKVFHGLSEADAGKLLAYVHLRPPKQMQSLLEQEHLSKSVDFLDSIAQDIPRGCWSVQYDGVQDAVFLRSLHWTGYVFFNIPEMPIYGGIYVGNGQKNKDLPFML